MGGCAKVLFWMLMAALLGVFLLLDESRTTAAILFVVALGLLVAYNVAEAQQW